MKITKIVLAGLAAGTLVLTGCSSGSPEAGSGGEKKITLTLGHAGNETDARQVAATRLKEIVEEKSGGDITVEIYASSTLGTWEEMIEGLQLGTTDVVIESMLAVESYTDLSGIETAPFLYDSQEDFFKVWDGELGTEIKTAVSEASGYELLGNLYRGPRELNTKKPVTTLSELQGMTIRTPSAPTMLATWKELGARAEAMPANETYSALESGVLDGQENPLDSILFTSMYEVAPNINLTSHVYANYHFIMWEDYLTGLPEDAQKIIREAAEVVGGEYSKTTVDSAKKYREDLENGGATFNKITDREQWVEAVKPIYGTLAPQVQQWITQIQDGQ
ncbi:TRAP transporter substrate-binding protein [Mycetocola spongiae]|uniref:TRAP transporter substrate-binding protein n=1 Tax=Mycetocola spongiae TaxID=2859226 RepID=UPI001CF3FA1B|nr:TRAP transporter substrate-binding protein [Mycetocola spongiae]UCR88752.1 TRAP transporter substrate-binding protein [Mycetocola spongiae]